jgi:hypothetical protein
MGWLFESQKDKEERENRALEGILKAFETQIKNPQSAGDKTIPQEKKEMASGKKTPTAEDLAVFLARQGTLNLAEWENYKKNTGLC